jgi:hypothetical protein
LHCYPHGQSWSDFYFLAGCVLSALLARALEFCLHDKGVYVAQCAANLANNSELVEMAKVGPKGSVLCWFPAGALNSCWMGWFWHAVCSFLGVLQLDRGGQLC